MILSIAKIYQNSEKFANQEITFQGWIRTNRNSNKIGFLDLNDGSTLNSLQIVYYADNSSWKKLTEITTGSAVSVTGKLVVTNNAKQPCELQLKTLDFLNLAEQAYPIQKKAHSYEFLREQAHLRTRTDTFWAIFKVRNQIAYAIHQFFQKTGFIYLNSPIITANDAEGAGENFIVTTIKSDHYEKDFFGKKATLTVSGQLNAEAYAQAFKKVYTFGPTFRAENSNTARHAAEFWMVEPEMAFASLKDNIKLARDLIIAVVSDILNTCQTELNFFNQRLKTQNPQSEDLLKRLKKLTQLDSYQEITYTEVVELLIKAQKAGNQFIFNDLKWGMDLQSEHERYLCEEIVKGPVFVTNYPQAIKAFYMKSNPTSQAFPERKTVAAMDLLVPFIGELIGGSEREDDYQKLVANKKQFNIENDDLAWYFNLRKSGYAPSVGFGLGLERLIMLVTGISNIRDVIPFPRTTNNLAF